MWQRVALRGVLFWCDESGWGDSLEDLEVMFFELFELVVEDGKALLAVGDVGRGGREFVRAQHFLKFCQLLLLFLQKSELENDLIRYNFNLGDSLRMTTLS